MTWTTMIFFPMQYAHHSCLSYLQPTSRLATTKTQPKGGEASAEKVVKPRASGTPEQWKLQKTVENLDHYPKVLEYLTKERGLTRETINAYKVGAGTFRFLDDTTQKWVDHQCVTFPWLQKVSKNQEKEKDAKGKKEKGGETPTKEEEGAAAPAATSPETEDLFPADGEKPEAEKKKPAAKKGEEEFEFVLARMKYRPVVQKTFRLDPTGGLWGLFGFHLVPPNATEIVLTVTSPLPYFTEGSPFFFKSVFSFSELYCGF